MRRSKKQKSRSKKASGVIVGCAAVVLFSWFAVQVSLWTLIVERVESSLSLPQVVDGNDNNERKGILPSISVNEDGSAGSGNEEDFHIVFSTDCSGYQHWQGILLWYSAVRVHQQGTITRIASGCTLEQQTDIQKEWKRLDPTGNKFRVHFAPSTTLDEESSSSKYKYSNKPGGLLHWLQHQQFDNNIPLHNNTVVCLLDPDMILLKPITANLVMKGWTRRLRGKQQVEYIDPGNGRPQLLRMTNVDQTTISESSSSSSRVTTGHPAGQHFGIGGAWVQGSEPHARPVWQHFSKPFVCGPLGPCTQTSKDDAAHKYAVGPVYLATVQDWSAIAQMWWDFVPKVHVQYPHLLAEMYSLTMAVANLQLEFDLFSSYMVTGADVSSPTEAWAWIDDYIWAAKLRSSGEANKQGTNDTMASWVHQMCHLPTTPRGEASDDSARIKDFPMPTTLHYCQRYKLDIRDKSFLFAKRKIPHDVFSCDDDARAATIPFDLSELIDAASSSGKAFTTWTMTERRTLFAHCQLAALLQWARQRYREQACP